MSVDPHLGTVDWILPGGRAVIDAASGAPVAFVNDAAPGIRYLLDEHRDAWHTAEHRWGSGFVIGPAVSARWNAPTELRMTSQSSTARHDLAPGLDLTIDRRVGERLHERFVLANRTGADWVLGSIGVVTPFRDLYEEAELAIAEGVHAHIFPGGHDAWVLAQPMAGAGPVLSLELVEGRLDAYSIESRNQWTSSNSRGHIVLQPSDAARNAAGLGGQREIVIPAGGQYAFAWTLGWYDGIDDAEAAVRPAWSTDSFAAEVGTPITLRGIDAGEVTSADDVEISAAAGGVEITGPNHGIVHVEVGRTRAAFLFHAPLPELVATRVRFILEHQRSTTRAGSDADAFVPFDNRTGLTQLTSAWPDWSDGAERIGMPTLLQQARLRGWVGAEVDEPLRAWARFARERLLDESFAPRWGSDTTMAKPRLYNFPWLAHFFADQYRLDASPADLDTAARILERSYELGAEHHLSIGQPEAVLLIAGLLDDAGDAARGEQLRAALVRTAVHFAELGARLPSHEVNYEQSMVAPLVSLLALTEPLMVSHDGHPAIRRALEESVRWLRAFGGPQPHARLKNIGIRHWDGYWFGADRRWGDVFPHHWSALSAVALDQLPPSLRTPAIEREIDQIFHANLVSVGADGTGTAAFVFPSTVNGDPAYRADPLANDQDWSLTLLLRSGHAVWS